MTKKAAYIFITTFVFLAVNVQAQQLIKRTITKTDKYDFGAGGTLAVTGAPTGSIKITGAPANEIEITAEIILEAGTEADLAKLAAVTGFVTDDMSVGRTGIISVGTHNKLGDKKMWKKFPKNLTALPFVINYDIRVPKYCDLEINGGKGDLTIRGVQGSMAINFIETNADVDVINGSATATIATGTMNIALGVNGWAGRTADIQIGKGDLTVKLPSNMSAEINASILRTGKIENTLVDLKQRDRKVPFTDTSIMAKAGVGGAALKFTVGDGTLRLERLSQRH
jgi:hypothetical protein